MGKDNVIKKYDAIVVLSADEETTRLRIEKALNLYFTGIADHFVLNGFAPDWHNDSRLVPFRDKIEKISVYVVHARTTEENAYQTKKLVEEQKWKKIIIVSSETHIKRVKRLYHKFFPNYLDLEFVAAKEAANRGKRAFREWFADLMTWLELFGLPRGKDMETDEKIFTTAERRKSYLNKFNNLVKKF